MKTNFIITNVKSSVKLKPAVNLAFVTEKCAQVGAYCKLYGNLVSIKHKNISFVLFKSCNNLKLNKGQHLNITSCRTVESVIDAVEIFLQLLDNTTRVTNFQIDNYSCTSRIGQKFDLEKIYLLNFNHRLVYNPENFPGLFWWCDKKKSLCAVIYHTGKVNIVGSNNLHEISEFLQKLKYITNNG